MTTPGPRDRDVAKRRWFQRGLWRNRKGSVAMFIGLATPALITFGGMSIDQGNLTYHHLLLQQTSRAAALAGQTYLASYYAAGGTYSTATMSTINNNINTIVQAMMPTTTYGNVVVTTTSNTTSSVQIGSWDATAKTFTTATSNPNAVKVTVTSTAANGNAVSTLFGVAVGHATIDMTASSVASYANGLSGAGGFNTIILNDLSMSFSSEVTNQRNVDKAILDCISNGTNGAGKVGLTGFTGHSQPFNMTSLSSFNSPAYNHTLDVTTAAKVTTMKTWIGSSLNYCGQSGMPACSGSNIAAGLYSAVKQLQAAGIASNASNIIVITDGVPNASSTTYAAADGMTATPSSTINAKYGFSGCTTNCTDAILWAGAQAWAAYAGSLGINVSTVYYSGNTSGSSTITQYSNQLASLVHGNGIALVAPTTSGIDTAFAKFCSSMGAALKLVG
jgi:Flp pilus assembly protein TadG